MDTTKLIAIVTIILTLSIATERLVEIIKGYWPSLNAETNGPNLSSADEETEPPEPDPNIEARRKSKVNILSVICGIVTAFLASSLLAGIFKDLFTVGACNPLVPPTIGGGGGCSFDLASSGFLIVGLGLLASGGSALWNSILEYLLKIKDLKKIEVKRSETMRRIDVAQARLRLTEAKVGSHSSEKQ